MNANQRAEGLERGSEGAWTSIATRAACHLGNGWQFCLEWNAKATGQERPGSEYRPQEPRGYARSSFSYSSLDFQVQHSVISLMTLLSTQYKTPHHPSLQIKPIHRILAPRVILPEPTTNFTCTHCFEFLRDYHDYKFPATSVAFRGVAPHNRPMFDTKSYGNSWTDSWISRMFRVQNKRGELNGIAATTYDRRTFRVWYIRGCGWRRKLRKERQTS